MQMIQLTNKQKIGIGVAVAVTSLLLGLILYYMITHPVFTAAITDISIIVLAIVVLVMNVFLVVMLWQIIRLIDFLLYELKPVLESLQQTTSTVRGTATFVTDEVTTPIIDASAKAARVKGSLRFVVDSLMNSGQRAGRGAQGSAYGSAGAQSAPPPPWGTAGQAADANRSQEPAAGAPGQTSS